MQTLTVNNLTITISGKTVCDNLTASFAAGQSWGILGRNGVGKTTFLHALCQLRPQQSGTITIDGTAIEEMTRKSLAKKIGILLQHHDDAFPATVLETVLSGRHPHISGWQWESDEDIQIASTALKTVELDNLEQRNLTQLSGGERQRVSLATLLTQDPDIFLLDEPNSHLDIHYQITILNTVTKLIAEKERLLIMNLHDINLANRYCSHIILMSDNKLLIGTKEDILTTDNLSDAFQHPVKTLQDDQQTIFYLG